jgi:colicin import membrane protein
MHNGDFPEPLPSDRLGRMLVISMVFHVALFGGLVWYNSRTPRLKPLVPTYTVDLVNMPLPGPAPGLKTDAPHETPAPGLPAPPMTQKQEKSGHQTKLVSEPKSHEAKKLPPLEKKSSVQVKPAASPPPAKSVASPPQPQHKITGPPPKVAAKPEAPAPKHAEPPTPVPALKPAAPPQKNTAPKTVAEARAPAEKVKKSTPEAAASQAKVTDARARQRQLVQEINAAQKKAAEASRDQKIQESIHDLEKDLEAKSRDRAYKEAVGQAVAKLNAGKVSAKVSRGSGDGGNGAGDRGMMGSAQSAAYGAQVSQTVRRHWQPNCLQRGNMQNLKAVIIVRIMSDGSISASWFEKESGDRLFDQSAMTAVTRSSPLPALPPGQEKLEIGITFTPEWKASS